MKDIVPIGWIAGIGTWIILLGLSISQMGCFAQSNCDVADLLGLKVMGLIAIVPAFVVTVIISKIFRKK